MKENVLKLQFDGPENSPGFLLWKLTNLWQSKIRKVLKILNLTHVQFVLLANIVYLNRQKQNMTAAELSRHTKIDKMMISDVTKTLEAKGFIMKEKSDDDSRISFLIPTDKGKQLAYKAIEVVEIADKLFFQSDELQDYISITKNLISLNEK